METDYNGLSPVNDLSAYRDLLFSAPLIAEAMNYANLPQDVRAAIWARIDEVETAGGSPANIAKPASYPADPSEYLGPEKILYGDINKDITRTEVLPMYAAKVAHAFYHEVHRTFPWRIASYGLQDLKYLLNSEEEIFFQRQTDGSRKGIDWTVGPDEVAAKYLLLDHSPAEAYSIASSRWAGANTPRQAADKLFKTAFVGLIHWAGVTPWTTISVLEMFNETPPVSRTGCHTTSIYVRAIFQSINIPCFHNEAAYLASNGDYTNPNNFGHAEFHVPIANVSMGHADYLYAQDQFGVRAYPTYAAPITSTGSGRTL